MEYKKTDLLHMECKLEKNLTLIIGAMMLTAALVSIFFWPAIYTTEDLTRSFLANDFINVLIGIPVLVIPQLLIKNNKGIGMLLWPGALLYVIYNYLVYLLSLHFLATNIIYSGIVILSMIVLWRILNKMDINAVRRSFAKSRLNRWISAILMIFGTMFLVRAAAQISQHVSGKAHLAPSEIALNSADIIFSLVWITCGSAFLLRKPLGYKTAPGLMYQLSMLFVGLIGVMVIQPIVMHEAIAFISIMLLVGMSLVVVVPFILFIKRMRPEHGTD